MSTGPGSYLPCELIELSAGTLDGLGPFLQRFMVWGQRLPRQHGSQSLHELCHDRRLGQGEIITRSDSSFQGHQSVPAAGRPVPTGAASPNLLQGYQGTQEPLPIGRLREGTETSQQSFQDLPDIRR